MQDAQASAEEAAQAAAEEAAQAAADEAEAAAEAPASPQPEQTTPTSAMALIYEPLAPSLTELPAIHPNSATETIPADPQTAQNEIPEVQN